MTAEKYNHKEVEKKWQEKWKEAGVFKTNLHDNKNKVNGEAREGGLGQKYYLLDMFPYPSGDGLHMGHTEQAAVTDTYYRYKRMQGFNMLHPQGFDSFGLPAENYAIKTGIHPKETISETTGIFKGQLDNLGMAYDFTGDVVTSDPSYYKWTQHLFGKFFEHDIAYKKTAKANWCNSCNTVIANEQVEAGKCERCGTDIEQKDIPSWMFRITDFADDLIWNESNEHIDWPGYTKVNQNNWIGKSSGAHIDFELVESEYIDINRDGGGDSYQDGVEEIERFNVVVVVESPDGEEFLCAKWKKVDWQGFVTGGIEDGDTAEVTAIKEVQEETGYQNPEIVKVYNKSSHGKFYHVGKKVNRFAHYRIVHVKLKDLEQKERSQEEKDIADIVWVPKNEVNNFLKREDMKYPWRVVTGDNILGKTDKVLLATNNKSKKQRVLSLFEKNNFNVEVLSPSDIGIDEIEVTEDGTLEENAIKKAKAYFGKVDFPIIANDTSLYIEGSELDPVKVKRNALDGKNESELSQEEVSQKLHSFYKNIAEENGGEAEGYWYEIWSLITPDGETKTVDAKREIILTNQTHGEVDLYFPIRSLYRSKTTGKYHQESTQKDYLLEMKPVFNALKSLLSANIKVFTTRADTLFGAAYMVLAPEHELLGKLKEKISNFDEVEKYQEATKKKSELERLEGKEKTGVRLEGVQAINPANKQQIPIFVSDYVLAGYGTGAIMAVPAHDERDFEFAKKFGIEIKQTVKPVFVDKINPSVEGKKSIVRDTVNVILINKETGDYGALDWKGKLEGVRTFVMGGIDEGKTALEAVKKEILEETGYFDVQLKDNFFYEITSEYFAAHKDVNRVAHINTFVFEVSDKSRNTVEQEEIDKHDLVWMKKEEIRSFLTVENDIFQWDYYLNQEAFSGNGILVNSGEFTGMDSVEAKEKITEFVGGKMTSTYRLRDWSISRQRYWGTPIPIVYSPEGEAKFVGAENLPWTLPTDVDFVPTGTAPLAKSKELVERTEKLFGKGWTPEVDTMDTFVDSSWYFLRYCDPENTAEFASQEMMKKWMPVDLYVGGAEHTYMHLLFARFFVKAMNKIGMVDFDEPFLKLRHQGMVNDTEGKKMSKSKGNVVNPDEMVERFGADATRTYMLFSSPLEDDVMWNEDNIVGVYRFLEKAWRQKEKVSDVENMDVKKELHKTIKSVTEKMEGLKFNVAVSDMMKFINFCDKQESIHTDDFADFVKILSPFAPHIADELAGEALISGCVPESVPQAGPRCSEFVLEKTWPKFDSELAKQDTVTMGIQVNGKRRAEIEISPEATEDEVKEKVLAMEQVQKWTEGKDPKKFIYVPGRIISVIV